MNRKSIWKAAATNDITTTIYREEFSKLNEQNKIFLNEININRC